MNTRESFSTSICKEQTLMAEREFSAFISAVKELLGPHQAQLSALDWLDELELMDSQPGTTNRHWRGGTIPAPARPAKTFKTRTPRSGLCQNIDPYKSIYQTFVHMFCPP